MMALLERWLFPDTTARAFVCNCATCIAAGAAIVALVAINIHQFLSIGWMSLTWISLGMIGILAIVCTLVGRSQKCRVETPLKKGDG
jgi:hypothetical protein